MAKTSGDHLLDMKKILHKHKIRCDKNASKDELKSSLRLKSRTDHLAFEESMKAFHEFEVAENMFVGDILENAAKKKNDDGKY